MTEPDKYQDITEIIGIQIKSYHRRIFYCFPLDFSDRKYYGNGHYCLNNARVCGILRWILPL